MTSLGKHLVRRRTELLTLSGFGSLTASAWTAFGTAAGLAALGVSALLVEFLTGSEDGRR
ncbi:MAG: hypothetical protein HOZ81_46850 [Streptomyces sp.]|nr:hypothetical protein [Streptomyces sp.]NUS24433.1 hypothetical protein [Streptomyces sp.]